MNEKNFYSFYKLNDDEKARLKEKISENNIQNPVPVPEETVRKKSAPKGKIIAVAVALSAVMFAGGVFVGVKFMPDRNNNSFSESEAEPAETEETTTEKATTKKTTTAKKTESKKSDNEINVNLLENAERHFKKNDDISAEIEDSDNGFTINVSDLGSQKYADYHALVYYDNIELSKDKFYCIKCNNTFFTDYDYGYCDVILSVYQNDELYYSDYLYAFDDDVSYFEAMLSEEMTLEEFYEIMHCHEIHFTVPNDDNVVIELSFSSEYVKKSYTVQFSDFSLYSCNLPDDFDRVSSAMVGYYDKKNAYHEFTHTT